jgi:hypothetical protein
MMNFFRKVLASLIVLLAVVVLWPLWPSRQYRELSLILGVQLLLLLAIVYGTLAVADSKADIRDRSRSLPMLIFIVTLHRIGAVLWRTLHMTHPVQLRLNPLVSPCRKRAGPRRPTEGSFASLSHTAAMI